MVGSSFHVSTMLLLTLILVMSSSPPPRVASLEIGIGGGGRNTSNAPSEAPQSPYPLALPPPVVNQGGFESPRIRMAYFVIQALRAKIRQDPRNDPKRITDTWVGPDVCHKYIGFRCAVIPTYRQRAVSDVQFNGFNLRAPIAGFIDKLVDVSIFHANSNRFYGVVPSNIGPNNIPFLFELDLSNNRFQGSFPPSVLQANRLTFLDLRFNKFSGQVPPQAFILDVDVLFMNNNGLAQNLPSDLGSTPSLYLTFANNNFTGGIPPSIGQASNTLREVLFLNNHLSGCLPWEIGQLRMASVFDASKNRLSGPIPGAFGCLVSMQILNLANNMLSGSVPEMVCTLPRLRQLILRNNYLTKLGPQCRRLLRTGKLDVRMNCIAGVPNQRSAAECRRFFSMPKAHRCPRPYLHMPCRRTASNLLGGFNRRGMAEVGPFSSVTYNALRRR